MYDGLRNLDVKRRPREHRGARRAARIGLIGILLFGLFLGASGFYAYVTLSNAFEKSEITIDELAAVPLPDEPINVLVLGSDRRDVVSPDERRDNPELRGPAGKRADTIILIHLSAKAQRAVAVHFPRDLRVNIPGHGTNKINAAYALGGPKLVIRTIHAFTGIDIHHYVEINFASFRKIVDAVEGVRICVTRAYHDRNSGLNIPKAGCYTMKGRMALAFVRARNVDPRADLGRIERQQLFMRALMKKVKDIKLVFNIPKVSKIADAIGSSLRVSQDVDVRLARKVAGQLSKRQRNVDFRVVPNVPRYINRVSYVLAKEAEARRLFRAIIGDTKLPNVGKTAASVPKRKDVSIRILNATGKEGVAGTEAARLRAKGFVVRSIGTMGTRARTAIRYGFGGDLKARLLNDEYDAIVEQTKRDLSTDLLLLIGRDFLEKKPSATAAARAKGSTTASPGVIDRPVVWVGIGVGALMLAALVIRRRPAPRGF